MAATSISSPFPDDPPQQQQGEQAVPVPGGPGSNNTNNNGSIGPFFAVISVLTVLAVISCILGRICRGRRLTTTMSPLERIKGRDCSFGFGWFRRKCRLGSTCTNNVDHGQVLGNKTVLEQGQKENNDGSV